MAETPNSNDPNIQDPLEALLDEVSDEDFGLPQFRDHFADSLTPAVLKDWSAKDFASIYVRFRPHLERHAKRFLVNPSQVEEVVQDAFLYLMTTLPELDSELGVLKFLKWKTRLLALDVIRANSKVSLAPLDDQPDIDADMPEMSLELERAEDAAIVSLALAKLQPRHREALIATMYEEKRAEVVAAQMGLSDNAFRQLLFRARSAFKKSLIGEAETAGLSMAEILSIAARKARAESGKYVSAAGAFLLVLAISIGVLPNLSGSLTSQEISALRPQANEFGPPDTGNTGDTVTNSTSGSGDALEGLSPESNATGESELVQTAALDSDYQTQSLASGSVATAAISPAVKNPEVNNVQATASERIALEGSLRTTLGRAAAITLATDGLSQVISQATGMAGTLTLTNGKGLTGSISYDLATQTGIQHTWFTISVGGQDFIAAPKVYHAQKLVAEDGSFELNFVATDLLIGDTSGTYKFIAIDDTVVSRSAVRVTIRLDSEGQITSSNLSFTPRS
jgi:RNA polymerase sigma-70 factor (ECF subfamily)